jgi:hypothetical protein
MTKFLDLSLDGWLVEIDAEWKHKRKKSIRESKSILNTFIVGCIALVNVKQIACLVGDTNILLLIYPPLSIIYDTNILEFFFFGTNQHFGVIIVGIKEQKEKITKELFISTLHSVSLIAKKTQNKNNNSPHLA